MSDLDLGPCCGCLKTGPTVRTLLMLTRKAPIAGHGWGCFECGLPPDGAQVVLCDRCAFRLDCGEELTAVVQWACRGYPGSDGRVPISELRGEHYHDLSRHEEQS